MKFAIISFVFFAAFQFALAQDFCADTTANTGTYRCCIPLNPGIDNGDGCTTQVKRYRYELREAKCVQFTGCDTAGIGNNFPTDKDCMDLCRQEKGRCYRKLYQPVDISPDCGTATSRWTYIRKTATCQEFDGCPNSAFTNSFISFDQCKAACNTNALQSAKAAGTPNANIIASPPSRSGRERCNAQLIAGLDYNACAVSSTRFFYNSGTRGCLAFMGCPQPVGNNFASYTECVQTCI